ncbi:MAG: hypothetical protein J5I90_10480 [Caldilineales bacterium]|nr:hypothetical protein [Caldilineales bacterium]
MARRKDRKQRLERTVSLVQQQYGSQALQKGMARGVRAPHISTGFAALDEGLGIGGIPKGRITTFSGAATSGKVTLAALVLARAQQRGRAVAYLDVAHTANAEYLQRCGVQLTSLLLARPENGRQALEILQALTARTELAAILFDNWGAVQGERSAEGTLAQLTAQLAQSKAALLVLDDGPPLWRRLLAQESALAHFASVQLNLDRERWLVDGPDVRGYRVAVTIRKNKFGPSGQSIPVEIEFNGTVHGQGI